MPDMLEELTRETIDRLLKELPVEKRLEGLSIDELFAALPPKAREAIAEGTRRETEGERNAVEAGMTARVRMPPA
jgi:nucleotidyltransferase/DNA polymerase involved in DNA repair